MQQKKINEQQYTFDEYLELELNSEYKNEFWDGTIQLYSIDCEIALKDIYKRIKDLGDKDDPKAY